METILSQTRVILFQLGFLPIVIVTTILTLYIFWKSSLDTEKNANSVFDGFLFSSILMVIWGRITYILTNPIDYQGLIWSFIPYERYPDGLYIFRLLPWRYLRIWDGEFLFTGLFIGFIIGASLFILLYKRWRWREMMGTVIFSSALYLGILLLVSGFLVESNDIFKQGVTILSLVLISRIVLKLLTKSLKERAYKTWESLSFYLTFFFSVLLSIYIPSSLLSSEITYWDRVNLYVFIVFSIVSHLIFVIDVFRKNVKIKTEYRTRSVSISANQPIKI